MASRPSRSRVRTSGSRTSQTSPKPTKNYDINARASSPRTVIRLSRTPSKRNNPWKGRNQSLSPTNANAKQTIDSVLGTPSTATEPLSPKRSTLRPKVFPTPPQSKSRKFISNTRSKRRLSIGSDEESECDSPVSKKSQKKNESDSPLRLVASKRKPLSKIVDSQNVANRAVSTARSRALLMSAAKSSKSRKSSQQSLLTTPIAHKSLSSTKNTDPMATLRKTRQIIPPSTGKVATVTAHRSLLSPPSTIRAEHRNLSTMTTPASVGSNGLQSPFLKRLLAAKTPSVSTTVSATSSIASTPALTTPVSTIRSRSVLKTPVSALKALNFTTPATHKGKSQKRGLDITPLIKVNFNTDTPSTSQALASIRASRKEGFKKTQSKTKQLSVTESNKSSATGVKNADDKRRDFELWKKQYKAGEVASSDDDNDRTSVDKSESQSNKENKRGNKANNAIDAPFDAVTASMILPTKLILFVKKCASVDTILQMHASRNHFTVTFEEVKRSIERIHKRKFSYADLERLMYLCPTFYQLKWISAGGNNQRLNAEAAKHWVLAILLSDHRYNPDCAESDSDSDPPKKGGKIEKTNAPTSNGVSTKFMTTALGIERQRIVRHKCVEFVASQQLEWCRQQSLIEVDALQTGEWHRRYDLENCEDSPLAKLPPKPSADGAMAIDGSGGSLYARIMAEREATAKRIAKAMEEHSKTATETTSNLPPHLRHLDTKLMAKMRAKTEIRKEMESKQLGKDDQMERLRWSQLPYLVNLIRSTYISEKKSAMPYSKLLTVLRSRHRNGLNLKVTEIDAQLQLLMGLSCKFFHVKAGKTMKIAKVNLKLDAGVVRSEISTHTT